MATDQQHAGPGWDDGKYQFSRPQIPCAIDFHYSDESGSCPRCGGTWKMPKANAAGDDDVPALHSIKVTVPNDVLTWAVDAAGGTGEEGEWNVYFPDDGQTDHCAQVWAERECEPHLARVGFWSQSFGT